MSNATAKTPADKPTAAKAATTAPAKADTKPAATPATAAATATPDGPIVANVTITPTTAVPAPAPKGKTVKVKVERSHPDFGYFAGDEGEISEEDFKKYGTGSEAGEFFSKLK